MADIKKIKEELLREFNGKAPAPAFVAKDDVLDTVLAEYFSRHSHMPKELTLDAIARSLRLAGPGRDIGHERLKAILDKHLPP